MFKEFSLSSNEDLCLRLFSQWASYCSTIHLTNASSNSEIASASFGNFSTIDATSRGIAGAVSLLIEGDRGHIVDGRVARYVQERRE